MNTPLSDPSFSEMVATEIGVDSLKCYLDNSHGEPVMSNEDVKLCLVSLMISLEKQQRLNESLISRINELENWKSKFRFWKK